MAHPPQATGDDSIALHRASAPLAPAVARQAVDWLLALQAGGRSGAHRQRQQQALQDWLAQSSEHARAWARIAEVDGQLHGIGAPLALRTLGSAGHSRRAAQLALLLTAGAGGLLAVRYGTGGLQAPADLVTATGERRETRLADGTRLVLNTASAVDLRFSATERLLVLRAGEVWVETAPDPAPAPNGAARPLRVRTAQGTVRAIGTRFSVRQRAGRSDVAVLQGAVELQPEGEGGTLPAVRLLQAGEQGHFTRSTSSADGPARAADSAWQAGMLVADDLRLGDFVATLARHRPGLLRCADDAAGLRVSGAYPLADTDRVLAALTLSLPVQVTLRTRWWVTVSRRGPVA